MVLSNFNYKHRFTLSTVIEMPFGHGRKFLGNAGGIENALVGGWQLTSIATIQSGAPFSVSSLRQRQIREPLPDRIAFVTATCPAINRL